MATIAAGGEVSVVTLLGDSGDVGVIRILELTFRGAGGEFETLVIAC
jgi:hypothetical protein